MLCGLGGCIVAIAGWLLLVRWDMSEIDAIGRHKVGGGDDLAPRIGLVLAIATAVCSSVAVAWPRLPIGWSAAASSVTWVLLFSWRASVSRTNGANLWPVMLGGAVIPAAAVSTAMVLVVHALRTRQRTPR